MTLGLETRERILSKQLLENTSSLAKTAGTSKKEWWFCICTCVIIDRNACRQLYNFSKHRHLEDAISVDRIVKELKEETPSPVLYYKPQGVVDSNFSMLLEDTFLLVIMTGFQASLFETFGERIVCLDSTHKTNQYRFKLLTVLIPDEYRNGIAELHCTCMYVHDYIVHTCNLIVSDFNMCMQEDFLCKYIPLRCVA